MKMLVIKPEGWPCELRECPPGFFLFKESLCFKSEYSGTELDSDEVFCESGEMFWGGTKNFSERSLLMVQPCIAKWEDHDY
jgi:hypothetical protein